MPAAQPSGYGAQILEPFNIPTQVNAPIQKPPNAGLTFPVFTPPAASSYGTTNPMPVPWTPPDLAGAIDRGIHTGASLATDALTNRKSLNQINAEEQAAKGAIQAMHDPNMQQNIGYEMGSGGFTARVISPAEAQIARANLAKTAAETELSSAGTAEKRGLTPGAQAEIEQKRAEAAKTEVQTGLLGQNVFQRRRNASIQSAGQNVGVAQPQNTSNTPNQTNIDYSQY